MIGRASGLKVKIAMEQSEAQTKIGGAIDHFINPYVHFHSTAIVHVDFDASRVEAADAGEFHKRADHAYSVKTIDVAPKIATYLGTKPQSGALSEPLIEALK